MTPITKWIETFFEMSIEIVNAYNNADDLAENYGEITDGQARLIEMFDRGGRRFIMKEALDWADEFEKANENVVWGEDKEFYEEIDNFVKAKLK